MIGLRGTLIETRIRTECLLMVIVLLIPSSFLVLDLICQGLLIDLLVLNNLEIGCHLRECFRYVELIDYRLVIVQLDAIRNLHRLSEILHDLRIILIIVALYLSSINILRTHQVLVVICIFGNDTRRQHPRVVGYAIVHALISQEPIELISDIGDMRALALAVST